MTEHNTEMIMVRLKPAVVAHLDKMKDGGGYKSRAELIRLLIEAIVKDDIAENEVAA